jgi:hypothetical protein
LTFTPGTPCVVRRDAVLKIKVPEPSGTQFQVEMNGINLDMKPLMLPDDRITLLNAGINNAQLMDCTT